MSSRGWNSAACRAAQALQQGEEWLRRVGLAGFGDRYPHQMSGGMRKRLALAQTLILSPDILLMDEPFSALDVQTRQLMENELLALWAEDRKSVLFITHDLEEAIALSDRVVVLSAGPGTRPIGDFRIDLPRPRDVSEIRMTPAFLDLHREIWAAMKEEVLKAYQAQKVGVMRLRVLQFAVFAALILLWHVFTKPGLIPAFYFEQDNRAAFFFGEPVKVFWVIVEWFTSCEIFQHLGVTLLETMLGFVIGAVAGWASACGSRCRTPPRR